MKKKIVILIAVILIILTSLIICTNMVQADTYYDEITKLTWTYTLNDAGEATNVYISDYTNAQDNLEDITIPQSLDGHTVVSVGDGSKNILGTTSEIPSKNTIKVSLPNTLKQINNKAFYNFTGLKTIYMPEGLTTIGSYAFYFCENLQAILTPGDVEGIPVNVTSIGDSAFYNCKSLGKVKIPSGVTTLENNIFKYCVSLKEVTIPDSVTTIGSSVFQGCSVLTSITIPDSVTTIGSSTFYDCSSLDNVKLPSTLKNIASSLFYNCKLLKNITIPDAVTSIGASAFYNCYTLGEVTIGNSVTSIGDNAFYYCSNIKEITIPSSVKSINKNSFYFCKQLKKVNFEEGLTSIGISAFESCTALEEITFPNTLTTIGNYAFSKCTSLKDIDFKEAAISIGSYAFRSCTALEKINIGENVKTISSYAFADCTGLTGDLIIPNSVYSIGEYAFSGCSKLNGKLIVGTGMTSFNKNSFYANNFSRITLKGKVSYIYQNAFNENVTDIWIDQEEENIKIWTNYYTGRIHYKNCKHNVSISTLEGVEIKDKVTGNRIESAEYECEENLEFYIEISENVKRDDLTLILSSIDDSGNETSDEVISLRDYNDETYLLSNILYDRKISILNISPKSDLSLRTYVSEINNVELAESREPIVSIANGKPSYNHTKYPLIVDEEDMLTYNIRIYNEGAKASKVNSIKEFIPEGLEFVAQNKTNIEYGWIKNGDGTLSTSHCDTQEIEAYKGLSTPNYIELKLVLRVSKNKQIDDTRLVNIVEIVSATEEDANSNYGSITGIVDSNYKYEESMASNSSSYIKGQEDDDDFENIILPKEMTVTYQLAIKKIDIDTKELLNGAEFQLLDEKENVLKTSVTVEEGNLDFGLINKAGNGVDTYYLVETKTPEGYQRITRDKIKLEITRNITDRENEKYDISVKSNMVETDVVTNVESGIPIYTKEQLSKIGSEETITINDKNYLFSKDANYKLENDIDLAGEEWKPIANLNGTFNGKEHTIKNMTININNNLDVLDIGLFGKASGEIINLNVTDVNIVVENMTEGLTDAEEIKNRLDSIHVGAIAGYFETGTIKNCTVTGKISAESNSVGGLIGYSNGYVLARACTNSASVSSTSSNVGGVIGYANSSISLVSCKNEGEITAGAYNAGGLVGYAQAGAYEQENVNIVYANNKVTVVIENRKISDDYSLVLENRNIEDLGLLKDGVFTIYDVSKNAKYENVKLKEGTLKIADISIEKLGTDTYYIEQLEAMSSYDKSNNYVKLIVTKTWNGETEEYEVAVEYEVLTEEEFKKETATDESYSDSSSGNYYSGTESEGEIGTSTNITPVINTISLKDCINTGKINNNNEDSINAAGMIAKTYGNVVLTNCSNEGTIESSYRSAGIVAEALSDEQTEQYITAKECTNKGSVTGGNESSGIIAKSLHNKIEITDSTNSGEVSGDSISGIITYTGGNALVKDCKNEGSLAGGKSLAGGIVGKCFNENATVEITNCNNLGDVNGSTSALICAYSRVSKIILNNCTSSNVKITGSCISGILSYTKSDTEITNCNIDNVTTGDVYTAGGILGYNDAKNNQAIYISGCSVKNTELNNSGLGGGVIAGIRGYVNDCQINILNVNIENVNIKTGPGAFILGFALSNNGLITIKNCNVNKSTIGNKDHIGGAVGYNYGNDITIDKCNIEESGFIASSLGSATGGFVGYQATSSKKTIVTNSKISKFEFDEGYHIGGVAGFTEGDIQISNVIVENITKEMNGNTIGGLIGYSRGKIDIENSKVSDIEEMVAKYHAGGFIGCHDNGMNININNSHVKNIYTIKGTVHGGGFIALASRTSKFNVENSSIITDNNKTCNIQGGDTAGGIAGYVQGTATVNNIEAYNISVNSSYSDSGTGAIIGTIQSKGTYSEIKMKNIDVINEKGGMQGGIVGLAKQETEINKVDIEDINITGKWNGGLIGMAQLTTISNVEMNNLTSSEPEGSSSSSYTYGAHGGIVGLSNGKSTITNANIKGVNITTTGTAAGGMIGMGHEDISDINISDVNISGADFIGTINGCSGYSGVKIDSVNASNVTLKDAKYLGGISGISLVPITNSTVNELTIEAAGKGTWSEVAAGGIAGVSSKKISNCKVTNIKINIDAEEKKCLVAGILGAGYEEVSDCSTDKGKIIVNGKSSFVGGITGGSAKVTNCNTTSLDITASTGYAGGISGIANNITNCNTTSTNITIASGYLGGTVGSTTSNIDNCTVTGGTLTGTSDNTHVGGVVGSLAATSAEIKNNTVKEVKISNTNGYTGGIAGYTNATISKSKVLKSEVKATSDSAYAVGGLVGHGSNLSTGYTYLTECEISDSEIIGKSAVGGVSGAALPNMDSCKITNTKVTGTTYVGGLVGFGGDREVTEENATYTLLPITATGCTLTGLTITGTENVSDTIGLNSYNGTSGEDKVTDCTITDCEIVK